MCTAKFALLNDVPFLNYREETNFSQGTLVVYSETGQLAELTRCGGADIIYIRMKHSWLYLVAVTDWMNRYVLSWELSVDVDVDFCIMALERAFTVGAPEVFNSNQGSQFTSLDFIKQLKQKDIQLNDDLVKTESFSELRRKIRAGVKVLKLRQ